MGSPVSRFSPKRAVMAASAIAVAFTIVVIGALVANRPVLAQSVNINEIFWCEGKPIGDQTADECAKTRSLILAACTSCHVFTPIVVAQKTADEWDAFLDAHRQRVSDMSDADFEGIRKFVKAHFNPENPVPQLPPALLDYTLPPA
jgi:hypothetical protein